MKTWPFVSLSQKQVETHMIWHVARNTCPGSRRKQDRELPATMPRMSLSPVQLATHDGLRPQRGWETASAARSSGEQLFRGSKGMYVCIDKYYLFCISIFTAISCNRLYFVIDNEAPWYKHNSLLSGSLAQPRNHNLHKYF